MAQVVNSSSTEIDARMLVNRRFGHEKLVLFSSIFGFVKLLLLSKIDEMRKIGSKFRNGCVPQSGHLDDSAILLRYFEESDLLFIANKIEVLGENHELLLTSWRNFELLPKMSYFR